MIIYNKGNCSQIGEMPMVTEAFYCSLSKYESMSDNDVIMIAKEGDSSAIEYLLNKYKKLVAVISAPYFLIGGDRDDIIQEGMIGLLRAITTFDKGKGTSFTYFAEICVRGQIITAIKAATRKKHAPLNHYVSLSKKIYHEGSDITLIEILEGNKVSDPMEVYINEEKVQNIIEKITKLLSPLELRVFVHYLSGKSYKEISLKLEKDQKCIDNTLQRVRKKLVQDIYKSVDKDKF